jgi:hypothetical protein
VVPRVFLVVVLAAAASSATGLVYGTISAPSRLSADAPRNLDRPVLRRAGTVGDEVQFNPYELEWRSPVRGVPFQLRYSWLRCDLNGANCSPLAGLSGKTIAPPQEERIVTLRGVVTGTNRYGSRSVVTRNFYYDMAGLAFGVEDRRFVRNHLQYNPDQLRAWYGLSSAQDGAGQTIMITGFGRERGLRNAVSHFSAHYGLPQPWQARHAQRCFQLVLSHAGEMPTHVDRSGEGDADVEWAHVIAPKAKIVFVQFKHLTALFGHIWRAGTAGPAECRLGQLVRALRW